MLCVKVSYLYIHQDRKGLRQSICSKTRAFTVIIFASQTACIACMQTPWPGKAGPGLWPLDPWSHPTWKSRFHTRSWGLPFEPRTGSWNPFPLLHALLPLTHAQPTPPTSPCLPGSPFPSHLSFWLFLKHYASSNLRTSAWAISPSWTVPRWVSELKLLSHVWLFPIPWTVTCQAPLSVEFPRQEYWSR